MAYQEISLLEFNDRFNTEQQCIEYLFKVRWPDGFHCPRCGYGSYYKVNRGGLYKCQSCGYQTSVTAETIFHRTKVPLRKWFWLIYRMAVSKTGISILGMGRELGIRDYKTIWVMAHKVRHAMRQRDERYKLAGLVELDESFIGPKSKNGTRGRGSENKTTVLIAVSVYKTKEGVEKPGFAHAQVIEDASADTIKNVLDKLGVTQQDRKNLIEKIRSDGWKSYGKVAKDKHMEHHRVVLIEPKMAGHLLPWTHRLVSNIKAVLRGPHRGVSKKHLQLYLSEVCYRFNRRYWGYQLFDRLLFACTVGKTVTRAQLFATPVIDSDAVELCQ